MPSPVRRPGLIGPLRSSALYPKVKHHHGPQSFRTLEESSGASAEAGLAGLIFESLDDEPADEGVEAAWSEEIKRRIEEIDSGKVEMIPYEEARRRWRQLIRESKKSGAAKP